MLSLSSRERRALESALDATRDRRHWCRMRAVLLAAAGTDVAAITALLRVSRSSVFDWLAWYRQHRDPQALADAARSGRPLALDAAARARLAGLLADSPERFGYRSAGWTAGLLTHHLRLVEHQQLSERTVRQTLHALGYRWKRPRYVLARRDEARTEKKAGAPPPRRARPGAPDRRPLRG
jgi:transposase